MAKDPTQPTPYDDLFEAAARETKLPVEFVKAIAFQESGFDPKARSGQNAQGIMQMLPATAAEMGAKDPWDPAEAIPAAARYLRQGYDKTGSLPGAAAYYHGGPDQRQWGPKTQAYVQLVGGHLEKLNGAKDVAGKKQPLDLGELDKLYGAAPAPAEAGKGAALDLGELDKLYGAAPAASAQPEAEKPRMAITVRPSGVLSNKDTDDEATALLKNIGTGAALGVGGALAPQDVSKKMADYLLARGAAMAATGEWNPKQETQNRLLQQTANQARMEEGGSDLTSGIRALTQAISPNNLLPSAETISNLIFSKTGRFEPRNALDRIVQGGAAALTGAMGPGSIRSPVNPANVAPQAGAAILARPQVAQGVGGAASPLAAASGAAAQGVTDLTGDPLLGMAAGGVPAVVTAGAQGATNRLMGTVSPERARLAQVARDQYGIELGAGQISDSDFVRRLTSMSGKVPGGTNGQAASRQQGQFNRAVAQTFGEDAERVTPAVMENARNRLSAVYEDLPNQVPHIATDAPFHLRLQQLAHEAQSLGQAIAEPIQHQVNNVLSAIDANGNLTGAGYRALIKRGSPLDRAANGQNRDVAAYARDIRTELNRVFEQSAPPEIAAQLRETNRQWRNMRTIEDIVAKAPDGNLSPGLLQGRVNAANKGTHGAAYGGGGELKEIADISRLMLQPSSSGTAENLGILGMLGSVGGIGNALMSGPETLSTLGAAVGVPLMTMGAARGANAFLQSPGVANNLILRSLGQRPQPGFANELIQRSLAPVIQNRLTQR